MPPSDRKSAGNPPGWKGRPMSAIRFSATAPASPGAESPDTSPFTSATTTGTPCAASCSAITCSVLVLPVPVAPATSPCRFIIASGTWTTASGATAPSCTPRPSTTVGPSTAYASAIVFPNSAIRPGLYGAAAGRPGPPPPRSGVRPVEQIDVVVAEQVVLRVDQGRVDAEEQDARGEGVGAAAVPRVLLAAA